MAWSEPTLCKVVTATTGTNNYVLGDPSAPGPYRTDVQANGDGSLPDGSSVHYEARDTTVTGDASFERGWGVYTLATRTITRTAANVIDSDGGPGVLKSWGSGQRDLIILGVLDGSNIPAALRASFATTLGLPRLAAANLFTASQVISTTSQTDLELQTVTNGRRTGFRLTSALGDLAVRYFAAGIDPLTFGSGGTVITVGASTTLQKASGNKYDAFPSGQVLLSESVPTGWTRGDVTGGRLIKLATSADTLGAEGGSDDFFDGALATAGHTLQLTEIPAHTHVERVTGPVSAGSAVYPQRDASGTSTGSSAASTDSAGGGGSHLHAIATPNYRVMGRIIKS